VLSVVTTAPEGHHTLATLNVAASGPGWTHKAIRHISGAGDVAVGSEWAGDGVDTRQGAFKLSETLSQTISNC
jgi:hypothetical protein